jgi:hypothetical protein
LTEQEGGVECREGADADVEGGGVPGPAGGPDHGEEFLVILDPSAAADALRRLRGSHQVTHVGSPHVVVVSVSPGEPPPSSSTPGVVAVSAGSLPPGLVERLDEGEALFVTAWASRMTGPEKRRRGEGLPWDASGFEPPDPPADPSRPDDG